MYWDQIHAQHEQVRFATTNLKITPPKQPSTIQTRQSSFDTPKPRVYKPTARKAAPAKTGFNFTLPTIELPQISLPRIDLPAIEIPSIQVPVLALPKISRTRKIAIGIVSATAAFAILLTGLSFNASADDGNKWSLPNPFIATKPLAANADDLQFSQDGEYWKILGYWDVNVGYAGCGLCSYTSAIDIVTGSSYTPTDMLVMRGDWAGMDNWIDDETGLDGQTHRQFTYDKFSVASRNVDVDIDSLIKALDENAVCVICTGGPVFYDVYGNLYNYPGHFVCVYRYDHDSGIFHVHDSAVEHYLGTNVEYEMWQMEDMVAYTSSIVAYRAV